MPEPRCREWTRRSGFHNFHARDRNHCAECDRIFFSASGHRDAYGVFDGPAFAARLSQAEGSCVHLWCPNCGDCGEIVGAFNSDEDFVGELVTTAINTHNSTCSSESITQAE